jgi:dihydroorotate dehydrogenase (NAD+) catalytic subunit
LDGVKDAAAIELNLSCPNIKSTRAQGRKGAGLIAQDAKATFRVVQMARRATKKTLITKLSPNVTDITKIALAAEKGGSDAVALINTLTGMRIDVESRRPMLGAATGGLSGPAIRPVALRMVWEAYRKIKIPIIGMGGIIDTQSALEFIIAGASAVSIGTANFIRPGVAAEVAAGIADHLKRNSIKGLKGLTGCIKI